MFVDADGRFGFSYKRSPAVITAYGRDFSLPVRNAEFVGKISDAENKINSSADIRERAESLKAAISLFIGEKAADEIFPDAEHADLDEMQAFYLALAKAVKQKSIESIKEIYGCENIF